MSCHKWALDMASKLFTFTLTGHNRHAASALLNDIVNFVPLSSKRRGAYAELDPRPSEEGVSLWGAGFEGSLA